MVEAKQKSESTELGAVLPEAATGPTAVTKNGSPAPGPSEPPKARAKKEGGNSKRNKKNKKDVVKPLTKVVIRRLPPSMDEETFRKQIDPIPEYDDFYFVSGDWSLGKNASSRAYINFTTAEDIFLFKDKFDGYIFVDAKGVEYPAVVEYAPFQELPRNRSRKKDVKCGSIELDTHFIAFKEALEAEEKESAGKSKSKLEYSYKIKDEKKITSTPLLEFIAQKKQEKREEKRKKMEEKKKQKKEDRQKKIQPSKTVSEVIKEEKENDDDIMVRTVPSRLDPNHGKKDGAKKVNEKGEPSKGAKEKDKRQRNRKDREKEKPKLEKVVSNVEQEKNVNRKQERDRQRRDKDKAKKQEEKSVKPPPDGTTNKGKEDSPKQESQVENSPTEDVPKKEVKKYSERRKETRARAETRLAELEERNDGPSSITSEHFKSIPNIPTVDIKKSVLTPHVAPFIPKEKSSIILGESSVSLPPAFPTTKCTTEKSPPGEFEAGKKESTPAMDTPAADSSSSERKHDFDEKLRGAREARKIRNKDRPSIEIYQPRKRLASGTAGGTKEGGTKSEDERVKEKSDSDRSSDKSMKPGTSCGKETDKRHKLTKKASDKERPRDRRYKRKNSSDAEMAKEKESNSRKNSREEAPPVEPAPIPVKPDTESVDKVMELLEGVNLDA
ncbi:regulator of nonsense transcripts 3A [Toxorhynchites rutilus septentrionalis]|uniref:regulator of nonsense transcripts 3A n=1 Tax=Toxorhynchites rutilus septentrionalis TaxID=329112 RepID=UPI00247882DC|nr:regulator of nonsense transcripts 3A [Toxorhynchites rutilus septentrionalis]